MWKWDSSQLDGFNVSDQITLLPVNKILKSNDATTNLLKVLSCIGSDFYLSMLDLITGDTNTLQGAVTNSFIIPVIVDECCFLHDCT